MVISKVGFLKTKPISGSDFFLTIVFSKYSCHDNKSRGMNQIRLMLDIFMPRQKSRGMNQIRLMLDIFMPRQKSRGMNQRLEFKWAINPSIASFTISCTSTKSRISP